MSTPLAQLKNVTKQFKIANRTLTVLKNFSLDIHKGEILGLVGESGCGKTTAGRVLLRLIEPTSGEIYFDKIPLTTLSHQEMKRMRRRMQIVFQDPYASLNPRMTVQDIIGEPLDIHRLAKGEKRKERIQELLQLVGLNPNQMSRYPHEFSGGQRQRIGIARALAVEPEFLILDEPISALDVSIQAQVINLLKTLKKQMGLTYLFIAHDLAMIKYLCDRVAVMYRGNLVELASGSALYASPLHPYTQALLSAIPIPDPDIERKRKRIVLSGEVPMPLTSELQGCPFKSRCIKATEECGLIAPPILREVEKDHFVACHHLT